MLIGMVLFATFDSPVKRSDFYTRWRGAEGMRAVARSCVHRVKSDRTSRATVSQ
jgi:hypothetical protein